MAPEAVRGFQLVQLEAAGEIVAEAMSRLGCPFPRDRDKRIDLLGSLEPPHGASYDPEFDWVSPFADLDTRFFRVARTYEFGEHVAGFIRAHLDLFFRSTER